MTPEEINLETKQSIATPDSLGIAQRSAEANEQDHLHWIAFCYVADELTPEQQADFENRLSTELKAQEALASVVELSRGIQENYRLQESKSTSIGRAEIKDSVSDRSWTLSRLLLLAAAVLVMAVTGYALVQKNGPSTAHTHHHQRPDLDFSADEWISSFDEIDEDQIKLADSEENTSLDDVSEDENLKLDSTLISFYSEVLDGQQAETLLNSKSLYRESAMDL